jgi:hypothetical protein
MNLQRSQFYENILQLNHPSMHLDMCTKFYSLHFFNLQGFPYDQAIAKWAKVQYCIDDKNSWRFAKCKFGWKFNEGIWINVPQFFSGFC